jgi:hypothetical protein
MPISNQQFDPALQQATGSMQPRVQPQQSLGNVQPMRQAPMPVRQVDPAMQGYAKGGKVGCGMKKKRY